MKSYFDLELFDDMDSLELGGTEELSCSCFRATCLFTFYWYYVTPFDNKSIYIDKGDETIELAPTWKSDHCHSNWSRYK